MVGQLLIEVELETNIWLKLDYSMKSRLLVLSGDHPTEVKVAYFSTFFYVFALFCTILVLFLPKNSNLSTDVHGAT